MAANWKLSAAAAMAGAVWLGGGLAQAADPVPPGANAATRAAYQRHAAFERLGAAFKTVNDEMRKDAPNAAAVRGATGTMVQLAQALPTWFPRGSGVEVRAKSEAKANIWTDAAGFAKASAALRTEVTKLNTLAAGGDWAGVRAQIRPTGGSCKGCHDTYRQKKDS